MTFINVGPIKQFKLLFCVWLAIFDFYLFYLIVPLNSVLNYSKSVLPFSVNKLTTGTYNFVSVILNVGFVGLLIVATAGFTSGFASLVALLVNRQSSAFSINVLLIFEMQETNGALFLEANICHTYHYLDL